MRAHTGKTPSAGEQRLSGLLIIELDDVRWSRGLEKWLADWQPAGVLLGGSVLRTPEATAEFLARVAQTVDAPPILALRESRGNLGPLHRFFLRTPSPRAVARQRPRAARKLGELIGSALGLLGFNTTFAPSLDLSAPYSDSLLDNHLFSSDPEIVARCGGAFIQGLGRHGILAAPGHFPGISEVTTDSVSKRQVADKSMAEMWREDLVPFRRLLPRLRYVLTSHLPYKAYDLDSPRPACMSKSVLQGLLRSKLGFRGVAFVDWPGIMHLMTEKEGGAHVPANAFSDSVTAGCDLQVVGPTRKWAQMSLDAIQRASDTSELTSARLEEASKLIRAAKQGLRRSRGKLSPKAFDNLAKDLEEFARKCKE